MPAGSTSNPITDLLNGINSGAIPSTQIQPGGLGARFNGPTFPNLTSNTSTAYTPQSIAPSAATPSAATPFQIATDNTQQNDFSSGYGPERTYFNNTTKLPLANIGLTPQKMAKGGHVKLDQSDHATQRLIALRSIMHGLHILMQRD